MPTECVSGRVAISPTICLSVSKSTQNVAKATKTSKQINQKWFKNQSTTLPKSHFVPEAQFWADCKPREQKKGENLDTQIRPNCCKNYSKREVKRDFTFNLIFVQILVTIFKHVWSQNRWKIYLKATTTLIWLLERNIASKALDSDVLQELEPFKTLGGSFKNRLCTCCWLC